MKKPNTLDGEKAWPVYKPPKGKKIKTKGKKIKKTNRQ